MMMTMMITFSYFLLFPTATSPFHSPKSYSIFAISIPLPEESGIYQFSYFSSHFYGIFE